MEPAHRDPATSPTIKNMRAELLFGSAKFSAVVRYLSDFRLALALVLVDVATKAASYVFLPLGQRSIGIGEGLYLYLTVKEAGIATAISASLDVGLALAFLASSAIIAALARRGIRPSVRILAGLGCLLALSLGSVLLVSSARVDFGHPALCGLLLQVSRFLFVLTLMKCSRSGYFRVCFSFWAAAEAGDLLSSLCPPFGAVGFVYSQWVEDVLHIGSFNFAEVCATTAAMMLLAAPAYFLITRIIKARRSETITRKHRLVLYAACGGPLILLILAASAVIGALVLAYDLWRAMAPQHPVAAGSWMRFLTIAEYPTWPDGSLRDDRREMLIDTYAAQGICALSEADRKDHSLWRPIVDEARKKAASREASDWLGRHADYLLTPLVKVSIGDAQGVFLVDTGYSFCSIDSDFARRAGPAVITVSHPAVRFIQGRDALGEEIRLDRLVRVARMEVGSCMFEGFVAGVETINRNLTPVDGVIGANLLNHTPVTWDIQRGFVEFGPIKDTSGARAVPIRLDKSKIVEFPVLVGQEKTWVMLDTGHGVKELLSLVRQDCKEWGEPWQSPGVLWTPNAKREGTTFRYGITTKVSVAGISLPGYVRLGAHFNQAGWGLLLRFHKLAIDPLEHKMYLWPCDHQVPP